MASLDQVEMRRQQLEENVAKLRKTLQHWRTWDAEYEGLKEEVASANIQTEEDCARISAQLEGELVNKEEIYNLFGVGKGSIKEIPQVLGFITRRQDYVQRNITTISKQLQTAEDEVDRLDEEINRVDNDDTSTGPLTEIIEELDEEGNIISSNISQPETATDQILATLRKAGLTDLDPGKKESENETSKSESSLSSNQVSAIAEDSSSAVKGKQKEAANPAPSGQQELSNPAKKGVKFSDDVEERALLAVEPTESIENTVNTVKKPDPSLISGSFSNNDRVIELDDDDEIIGATPVIPGNESPEDANLRREMLQYSLNEIGSVVAELDLEEEYSDDDDDEDSEFDDDDGELSELSEEEDEHGRSLKKGVTSKYRKQMLELEEKLMARMIENVGPEPDENNPEIDREDLRKLVVRDEKDRAPPKPALSSSIAKEPSTKKKGVRFADALDVSEAPGAKPKQPVVEAPIHKPAPIIDDVLERRAPTVQAAQQEDNKPTKTSRFKQNRESASSSEPEVNIKTENRPILSDTIVEKPVNSTLEPSLEAREFDPEIQQRQLASEYYRMRNNMIRQQGGFKATEEETDQPLMEEVDGKVKKVSRFKAARLR